MIGGKSYRAIFISICVGFLSILTLVFIINQFFINKPIPQFTLTYTAGTNGSIEGTTPQTVDKGRTGTKVTAVSNSKYHFVKWSDNGSTEASRIDTNVQGDINATAIFKADPLTTDTLTPTAESNDTTPSAPSQRSYYGSGNTGATTVSTVQSIPTFTLTSTAGANGSITPNGVTTKNDGSSQTYTITPGATYHIDDVLVDGVSAGAVSTYTFSNVSANHTISVTFAINQLTISAPSLTLSKPYDGDTTAAVTAGSLSGVVAPDVVTVSAVATYDTSAVGTGKTITVVYTLGGADAAKYVKPVDYVVATGVITTAPLTAIGAITGTPTVGQVLTAGALTPLGATVTYQWQNAATSEGTYTDIPGATSSTYTLVTGDWTKFIKVVATGTSNYTGTQTSAATTVVTDPNWIAGTGTLSGKYVRSADLGSTYTWDPTDSICRSPQCATGLDPNYPSEYSFVSPQVNPGVDFSGYPAQNACKAIGGRLPNMQELLAIYAGKVSYGNNFQASYYWSATETVGYDPEFGEYNSAWAVYFSDGSIEPNLGKSASIYVRCVVSG
ncbi:hypothetical protein A3F37_00125 [Candidatus Saccharibacteria bacterium RIFCSPHIGHO2_12_FULL_41_12]|nr:MAG: hypothetical protein A3F37_00125 [Candidatus Saccharibacteria bacterium RIFCSPHIGHO2_12_FULL_41_12]